MRLTKSHLKIAMVLGALFLLVGEMCFGSTSTAETLIQAVGPAVVGSGVTTITTAEQSPSLLVNEIEDSVLEMSRDRAPLTTLLGRMTDRKQVGSLQVEYYTADYRAGIDTLKVAKTASDTAFWELSVNNIGMWTTGDTGLLEDVPAYTPTTDTTSPNTAITGQDIMFYVYKIDRASKTIFVQPVNGKDISGTNSFADDMAVNKKLVRLAPGSGELGIVMDPYADMPEKDYNLMQKYIATIEESTWNGIVNKEVKWGWDDYSRRQVSDMRIAKEKSYILGMRRTIQSLGDDGEEITLTGGALDFVTGRNTDLVSNPTMSNTIYNDICKDIFSGNGGSGQRILLAGDDLLSQLGAATPIQKQLEAKKSEAIFGIKYNRIETNFGELLLVRAPLFNELGTPQLGLSIDLNNLAERILEPMRTEDIDWKKSGKKDGKGKSIIMTSCPLWRYPDTHKWIEGATV